MTSSLQHLFDNNRAWAARMELEQPGFFSGLTHQQTPKYLWIGCSDSRVPANQITGLEPGEVFVHRNIANMVVHTDMNMLSVLDYAVNVLHVKHVIVCGHYGCGGVLAAMGNHQFGLIDNWLRHIKDGYDKHRTELDAITDKTERANRFVEISVMEQVHHLSQTSIIQNSWKNHKRPSIHGWVYDLKTGIIKDLNVLMDGMEDVSGVYKFDDAKS